VSVSVHEALQERESLIDRGPEVQRWDTFRLIEEPEATQRAVETARLASARSTETIAWRSDRSCRGLPPFAHGDATRRNVLEQFGIGICDSNPRLVGIAIAEPDTEYVWVYG
jgi:hypothetical protein